MKLAIFDFDGTLLMKDTLPCLGIEWLRQKRSIIRYIKIYLLVIPYVFLYKLKIISREKMKVKALTRFDSIFTNMKEEDIQSFFKQAYPNIRKFFNPKVIKEIESAKEQGYHCVLLSGAYSDLLTLVAKDLNIDTVIAVEITYKNGIYDANRKVPIIDGKTKLSLLKKIFINEEIDWESSKSFGDSYSDIHVMEIVGEPIAVNPDDRLFSHVKKYNWRTIDV